MGFTRKKINMGIEHCRSVEPNRHAKNTPPNNVRVNILLKCTYYIVQDRSYEKGKLWTIHKYVEIK